jgi:cytochrome c peroxidase
MIRCSLLLISCCFITSCAKPRAEVPSKPLGTTVSITAPLGLPAVPIPADNPPTVETIALGRRLFYEPRLSADSTVSCASCHFPKFGFADPKPVSIGVGGTRGTRNAPSVLNAAYNPNQFWDGRAATLEEQAAGPIGNPVEMNHGLEECIRKLNTDDRYRAQFDKAFGPGGVTLDRLKKAIASFERTLLSGDSPFDRYQYGGDKSALSAAAARGLEIFKDKNRGNCSACHTIGEKDALFTDGKFHNIGEGIGPTGEILDLGRFDQTKVEADKGAFRTPTLRNIAKTAPYMHDGRIRTLKEVVDFYVGGGSSNPNLDKEIKELKLNGRERADLVEFMESLTGSTPANSGPPNKP